MLRVFASLLILFFSSQIFAQVKTTQVDFMELVNELIITKKNDSNLKQVWWIPNEYWDAALNDTKYSNQEMQQQLTAVLANYTIVSVVDINMTLYAGMRSNEIEVSLTNVAGKTVTPIKQEGNEEVFELLEMIKPTMKSMLGQFGEKMNFFAFKNIDKHGNLIAGPYQKGELKIHVNNEDFIYKLPLAALVQKKICPTDNEMLNGNWDYCPWHGKKLINKTK
ncbi:hypothetical protein [Aequorivita marina]|uniref:hypothetical protein n=1 Tax=Aequorivita marina TaxID=3073654 RepID=UPI002875D391|nr:hypothetical protein [Aequorivita sp. S2608]MDS1299790.1 hypothetical protein [Aequorivita sp. S2608]